jgi:hypothetical protein
MFYERLEETDKAIEEILKWRDSNMKMVSKITNLMIELTLKQLGETIPQQVKEKRRGNRPDDSSPNNG